MLKKILAKYYWDLLAISVPAEGFRALFLSLFQIIADISIWYDGNNLSYVLGGASRKLL